MDKFEHKEGFGKIFGNDKKKLESQPDFTGNAMWRNEIVRIALWKKKDAKLRIFTQWGRVKNCHTRKRETMFQSSAYG